MIRTAEPTIINQLLRRDFGEGDLSEAVANPLNVCLLDGENAGIFAWRGPGIYEAHLCYEARGRQAIDLFKAMMNTMRRDYGAQFFWTMIPVESRHVRMFARLSGLLSIGTLPTQHGPNELFVSERKPCLHC